MNDNDGERSLPEGDQKKEANAKFEELALEALSAPVYCNQFYTHGYGTGLPIAIAVGGATVFADSRGGLIPAANVVAGFLMERPVAINLSVFLQQVTRATDEEIQAAKSVAAATLGTQHGAVWRSKGEAAV